MPEDEPSLDQLPASDLDAPVDLTAGVVDLRTQLPRWEAMMAEIRRLYAVRIAELGARNYSEDDQRGGS